MYVHIYIYIIAGSFNAPMVDFCLYADESSAESHVTALFVRAAGIRRTH